MNHRTFKLILGYLPQTEDECPPAAREAGLLKRFAWMLDSHRPDLGPDMVFDDAPCLALIRSFLKTLPHDTVEIVMFEKSSDPLRSFDGLSRHYAETTEAGKREPFKAARLFHNGALVGIMESEPYANVGGPEPYHDSYTLSVFVRDYDPAVITQLSHDIAASLHATLDATLEGRPDGFTPGRWKRFRSWIGV